jgi:hypothetical protein
MAGTVSSGRSPYLKLPEGTHTFASVGPVSISRLGCGLSLSLALLHGREELPLNVVAKAYRSFPHPGVWRALLSALEVRRPLGL